MDSLYPKLRAGFQAQWAPDGKVLHLYNRKTRQAFRLSRTCGQVLCSLDGQTWPGENTGLYIIVDHAGGQKALAAAVEKL